jgi:hypothetical protein
MVDYDKLKAYFSRTDDEVKKKDGTPKDRGGYKPLYESDDCQWVSKKVSGRGRRYRYCMHPGAKTDRCKEGSCALAFQLLNENRFEEFVELFGWEYLEKLVEESREARWLASNPEVEGEK